MNNSKIHSGNGAIIAGIIMLVAALIGAAIFVTYVLNVGINDEISILNDSTPAVAQIASMVQ